MSPHFEHEAKQRIAQYLEQLQRQVCASLEEFEPKGKKFVATESTTEQSQSHARILTGDIFERAAVHRTCSGGSQMPKTLVERRPELLGHGFDSSSLSIIVHPMNPYVPTVHANLRFFVTRPAEFESAEPQFWFGGGYDLTPCYGFGQDAVHWHSMAQAACAPFGEALYPRFKQACDEYFFLPHRDETRGIGGILFDDLDSITAAAGSAQKRELEESVETRFEGCFELVRSIGDHLLTAYLPIVKRRATTSYGKRERSFQAFRRGRYVEFNLLYDRGTRYGLKAGRRTEAVLSSLPPHAEWVYDWKPEEGSDEAKLTEQFLGARDWLGRRD